MAGVSIGFGIRFPKGGSKSGHGRIDGGAGLGNIYLHRRGDEDEIIVVHWEAGSATTLSGIEENSVRRALRCKAS